MNILDLGIIQITSQLTPEHDRYKLLCNDCIPSCVASSSNYVLIGPPNKELEEETVKLGGKYSNYLAWEKDMSRKWRQGIKLISNEWVGFFADDVYPDKDWFESMSSFLSDKKPGQYGFRLTSKDDKRHQFGEDWMQFPNKRLMLQHRPLKYDVETGWIEDSPTAYVANCVVHRDVLKDVEPFGLFGKAPDVMWSLAIRECGYEIGFNPLARAYHVGNRRDNRE